MSIAIFIAAITRKYLFTYKVTTIILYHKIIEDKNVMGTHIIYREAATRNV